MNKIDNVKFNMNTIFKGILAFIFISNSLMFTEELVNIYGICMLIVTFLLTIYAFFLILNNKSFNINLYYFWIFILFFMYFINGLLRPTFIHFNYGYFLVMFAVSLTSSFIFIGKSKKEITEIFVSASILAAFFISIYFLIIEWDNILLGSIRIGDSGSGNVNVAAINVGIYSIPCIYKIFCQKKLRYIIPYLLAVFIMLLTGSKKAILIIALSLIVFAILKYYNRPLVLISIIVAVIFIIILMLKVDIFYNIIGFRIKDFFSTLGFKNVEGNSSYSTIVRKKMIYSAIEAFKTKPIFGGGYGYFYKYAPMYGYDYSHCNYTEILSNFGLIGFFIYYFLPLIILIKSFKFFKDDYCKIIFATSIVIFALDYAAVSFSAFLVYYLFYMQSYLYLNQKKKEQKCLKIKSLKV